MQRVVTSSQCQQIGVIALFDDLAILDEQDLVGMHQGVQTMGHDDRHTLAGSRLNGGSDPLFGARVHGGRAVVKNQYGGNV